MSIEEQIDDVIKDWQGSRDSMHWSPPQEHDQPGSGGTVYERQGVDAGQVWLDESYLWRATEPPDGILRVERERPGAWWHRFRRSGS